MNKNLKTLLIIGGTVLAVIVILSVLAGLSWGWWGNGYGMMGMMESIALMFLMPVLWIVVVGLIIWWVVAAARGAGNSESTARSADSALEILKKRYARGEVNKEEYEAKKKDLT
ncbi:MAG: SHOCT domain-containing protein [Chloroflexota bacterium]